MTPQLLQVSLVNLISETFETRAQHLRLYKSCNIPLLHFFHSSQSTVISRSGQTPLISCRRALVQFLYEPCAQAVNNICGKYEFLVVLQKEKLWKSKLIYNKIKFCHPFMHPIRKGELYSTKISSWLLRLPCEFRVKALHRIQQHQLIAPTKKRKKIIQLSFYPDYIGWHVNFVSKQSIECNSIN